MTAKNEYARKIPTLKDDASPCPATIAGAVRLAVNDGRALLGNTAYAWDHATWHEVETDTTCRVCAAGAVMAKNFDIAERNVDPETFGAAWARALNAIDAVRVENYAEAYWEMYPRARPWREDREAFENDMHALLEREENAYGDFRSKDRYAKFLDDLEGRVLPVIEQVEAAMPRRAEVG